MGNSSSKEKNTASRQQNVLHRPSGHGPSSSSSSPQQPSPEQQTQTERLAAQLYGSRGARGGRPDLQILGLVSGRDNAGQQAADRPRETKQEREARKLEKERVARLKERERSMREEHVDGGYLVTLGTYTGVEDFNKGIVRQLQIERRLAPFWRGLNEHSESWTEAQLVAAARCLPIPAPDEIPPDMARTASQASSNPGASDINVNNLTIPISSRSQSYESSTSANLSPSHPAFSTSSPHSPSSPTTSTAQLFRGRAKTLASLATGTKTPSQTELTPQEISLPKDPYVNGQPIEAVLYKDIAECPICFMYYPPYLNKTRCCDQPICSECFVQIKRPDPHPPEHEQPGQGPPRPPEEEAETLVSEVASCPFCVTPEFGVSYEPPPFRRGLAYPRQAGTNHNPLQSPTSAMSSTSSLNATGGRRRGASLSANAPQVITTDRVRPDWAKKLADARAHALRRSAAATALHNAAYVLGNQGDGQLRGSLAGFSRRRRSGFGIDSSPTSAGGSAGTPGILLSPYAYMRAREGEEGGNADLFPARGSSRRTRVDDLEDLMMMEAIRLSLAAEEERKRKEEKDAKKDAKKKAKEEKREAKDAAKEAKRKGQGGQLYQAGTNNSSSTWASTSMARSSSNLGAQPASPSSPHEAGGGKGKAPAQDFAGFIPLSEPTSTFNTEMRGDDNHNEDPPSPSLLRPGSGNVTEEAQKHLEASRANIQPAVPSPISIPGRPSHARQFSDASSLASSLGNDSSHSNLPSAHASGLDVSGTTPDATGSGDGQQSMFNFRSLAAMVGAEEGDKAGANGNEHIEHAAGVGTEDEHGQTSSPNRSRGDSGESSASSAPPVYSEEGDVIAPAPLREVGVVGALDGDVKGMGGVEVLDRSGLRHQATQ